MHVERMGLVVGVGDFPDLDLKVYHDHAYIVADNAGPHGVQIFDLQQLRDVSGEPVRFEATGNYDRIASAHHSVS